MENSLRIKATEDTPEVNFNKDSGEFSLNGRSLPEDAFEFYRPVKAWLKEYIKQPNNNSDLKISLDYFNSSSVKQLLELIMLFEEISVSGKKASIIWCYSEGDDLMEIKGREFESMVEKIPFEFRVVS
jgi:hypothetical protein